MIKIVERPQDLQFDPVIMWLEPVHRAADLPATFALGEIAFDLSSDRGDPKFFIGLGDGKACHVDRLAPVPSTRVDERGYLKANLDVSNAIGLVANLRAVRMRLELMARTPKWLLLALARDIDKAERLVPPLVLRRSTFIRGPGTVVSPAGRTHVLDEGRP